MCVCVCVCNNNGGDSSSSFSSCFLALLSLLVGNYFWFFILFCCIIFSLFSFSTRTHLFFSKTKDFVVFHFFPVILALLSTVCFTLLSIEILFFFYYLQQLLNVACKTGFPSVLSPISELILRENGCKMLWLGQTETQRKFAYIFCYYLQHWLWVQTESLMCLVWSFLLLQRV